MGARPGAGGGGSLRAVVAALPRALSPEGRSDPRVRGPTRGPGPSRWRGRPTDGPSTASVKRRLRAPARRPPPRTGCTRFRACAGCRAGAFATPLSVAPSQSRSTASPSQVPALEQGGAGAHLHQGPGRGAHVVQRASTCSPVRMRASWRLGVTRRGQRHQLRPSASSASRPEGGRRWWRPSPGRGHSASSPCRGQRIGDRRPPGRPWRACRSSRAAGGGRRPRRRSGPAPSPEGRGGRRSHPPCSAR